MSGSALALVPARGGSVRVPGKNLRAVGGRPLIMWTLDAARDAPDVDRVVVSTDDARIAELASAAGAEVHQRPTHLATGNATTSDAVVDALNSLEDLPAHVVVLQPTSPLRTPQDIQGALSRASERHCDGVISVCRCEWPPEWANTLPADRSMDRFFRPGVRGTRSQDLPVRYRLNGAVYVYRTQRLLAEGTTSFDGGLVAYEMPVSRSIDIDTEDDLTLADCLLRSAALADEVP